MISRRWPLVCSLAAGAALLVAVAPAGAQLVGVPLPPPRTTAPATPPVVAAERPGATPRDTAQERQRLDIQAWVDSAAGALSESSPTPVPAAAPTTARPAPRTPAARPRRQPARPSADTRRTP